MTLALLAGTIFLTGVILFMLPSGLERAYMAVVRTYLLLALLALVLILLRTNSFSLPLRHAAILLIGLVIAAGLLSLVLIGKVPHGTSYDEAGELNLVYYKTGSSQLVWPMYPTLPATTVAIAWKLPLEIAGRWMQIAGAGIAGMRTAYLAFAWLGLPFLFFAAWKLYGRTAALAAVAIGAFIPILHDYARPDTFVALSLSVALACFVQARQSNRPVWHFLTGLSVAFGIEAHPYALRFVAAFGLVYLFDYLQALRRSHSGHRAFWSFVSGGIVFGAFFLAFHIYSVPAELRALSPLEVLSSIYGNQSAIASRAVPVNFLQRMVRENITTLASYFRIDTAECVLLVVVTALAVFRRTASDKLLLILFAISSICGAILLTHSSIHYFIFNLPFLALFSGAAVAQFNKDPARVSYRSLGVMGIAVGALCAEIVATALTPAPIDSYLAIGRQIDQLMPPNAVIVGHQMYFPAMIERRSFLDIENYYGEKNISGGPNITVYTTPDAIIYTSGYGFLNDPFAGLVLPYVRQYAMTPAYCWKTDYGDDVILYTRVGLAPAKPNLAACTLPS